MFLLTGKIDKFLLGPDLYLLLSSLHHSSLSPSPTRFIILMEQNNFLTARQLPPPIKDPSKVSQSENED
jgi:hypothetical protein